MKKLHRIELNIYSAFCFLLLLYHIKSWSQVFTLKIRKLEKLKKANSPAVHLDPALRKRCHLYCAFSSFFFRFASFLFCSFLFALLASSIFFVLCLFCLHPFLFSSSLFLDSSFFVCFYSAQSTVCFSLCIIFASYR